MSNSSAWARDRSHLVEELDQLVDGQVWLVTVAATDNMSYLYIHVNTHSPSGAGLGSDATQVWQWRHDLQLFEEVFDVGARTDEVVELEELIEGELGNVDTVVLRKPMTSQG